MVYSQLFDKCGKKTVSAALIGSGHFGTAVLTQSLITSRLSVPVIADSNVDAAKRTLRLAGIPEERTALCDSAGALREAMAEGKFAVTADAMLLMDLPLDVVAEATGNPEAGARHAAAALDAGKHVVMVNKETDSCVGPVLWKKARERGLVYTPVDGDQHGALIQMLEWAEIIGLDVIAAGKARDAEFIHDPAAGTVTCYKDEVTIPETATVKLSPEDAVWFGDLPQEKLAEGLAKRRALAAGLPPAWGFDLCEMVIAANALGMVPEVPELNDHIIRIPELPRAYSAKRGGKTVIDVVTCLRKPDESSMGGGVYLIARSENAYSQHILATKGCLSNRDGSISLIYRPYHLCGVEASTSLLCAGLAGISTGLRDYAQRFDIVQTALADLKAGDVMGNDHDVRLKTTMVPMSPVAARGPIPAHMLSGRALNRDVAAGTVITYDMIDAPADSVLWRLRKEQDRLSAK